MKIPSSSFLAAPTALVCSVVLAACGGGQSGLSGESVAQSSATSTAVASSSSTAGASAEAATTTATALGARPSMAAQSLARSRTMPDARIAVVTSTAAAATGGGAVTRYAVTVQSVVGIESVSLHQGSDPASAIVTSATRVADGVFEMAVPSVGATDALSTFVRVQYVDGNSVETSLAAAGG